MFGPADGDQACGDVGMGRMLEPSDIAAKSAALFKKGNLAGLNFLITGGPTREAIDPVRFVTNNSSGKMAYALADEAAAAGAKVTLISGPVNVRASSVISRIDVKSAVQMHQAVMDYVEGSDVFIGVAAVADYRPEFPAKEKIKKVEEKLTLRFLENPDIISEVSNMENKPFVVGFAAETNSIIENGKRKLKNKKLDLIFANSATETFDSDAISATAISSDFEQEILPGNKNSVARIMLQIIFDVMERKNGTA
jgi:phosphopantothenoylcysteine decarboxylase/phosphopantothenate--cysteine ligase